MSQYIVLSHIDIQNANSVAGLTWGFPSITSFLGFTHALSRKLSNKYEGEYNTELAGCSVISHIVSNKVYQPKQFADFEFLQSKNSPVLAKHKNASPPIIEEGKMNLAVSLVIELNQSLVLSTEQVASFEKKLLETAYQLRIAGGCILNIQQVKLVSASTEKQHEQMLRKIKKLTLPGFILLDRSDYLQSHYQSLLAAHSEGNDSGNEPQLLDAWLDFSALKYKAIPELKKDESHPTDSTAASWKYISKPYSGYLVPLMTGYKAISNTYDPGEILNTRDATTSSRFVEAIHSVGEWKGVHNITNLADTIWRYKHDGQWYLCHQSKKPIADDDNKKAEQEIEILNFNDAFNQL